MKRELPRGTNDEKKLRAIVSARSTSNPVQNYSETSNDPFRPSLGPGIPQYNFHHQVAPGADMADSESRVYGRPSVLPQSSYDFTTMREEPREDTRIQKTSYRRHSLDYGERHSMNEGDILREGGGDIVLHGIVGETTSETTRDKHASSPPFAIKMRSSAYPKSDQYDIDLNLSFPVKLHMILSDPQYQECVEWAPHGRAWKVLNPRALESAVIPKFFRSDKYSSFMRQVNGWAFNRISDGPDANFYWHPLFLRGLPSLANEMKRPPKTKNSAAVARATTGGTTAESPNFYRISRIAPLPVATSSSVATTPIDDGVVDDQIDPFMDADEMKLIRWGTPQPLEKNPFEDSSPETVYENVGSKTEPNNEALSSDTPLSERSQSQESQRLSATDLNYLAHQNQLLLLYVKQAKPR